MKAKYKKTGEIVDVSPSGSETVPCKCTMFDTKDGRRFFDFALDFLPDIDWEQRRYELVKDAMNSILTAPIVDGVNPNPSAEDVAMYSVKLADALIKELKGGE